MHGSTERQTAEARAERRQRLAGVAFMMASLLCFTCIDTSAKWLTRDLPVLEITFFRYLVAFLVAAAAFNPLRSPAAWRTSRPLPHFIRGFLLLIVTVLNFVALKTLQLAETMSIAFSVPFMVAILSVPLLGETVGRQRWGAIVLGFVGVLIVARPTPAHFDPAVGWAFAAAACNALFVITTRRMSDTESVPGMLLSSTLLPVLMLSPFVPDVWVMPGTPAQWFAIAVAGTCGALGHFLFAHALARAPASMLSPFLYVQIVWMTLSGWIVFGDVPGGWTIAGATVVITSGLWLVHIERARRNTASPSP